MIKKILRKFKNLLSKPPQVIFYRIKQELSVHAEKSLMPIRIRLFTIKSLTNAMSSSSLQVLWDKLAKRSCFSAIKSLQIEKFLQICPDAFEQLKSKADLAKQVESSWIRNNKFGCGH